jgi:hypothetical protein
MRVAIKTRGGHQIVSMIRQVPAGAAEGEPHRLVRRAAIKIIF